VGSVAHEEIARRADCPKRSSRDEKSVPTRCTTGYLSRFCAEVNEGSLNAHKLKLVDSECILEFTEKVVQQAAERWKLRHRRKRVAAFSEE